MFDIVIGRSKKNQEKFGLEGTVFLGKQYVSMGQYISLSNRVFVDVSTSHSVFICGKRGSGKSYTMGVIAEGIADLPEEVRSNISVVILDTMGIYWTMKFPNKEDAGLLEKWGLKHKGLNVKIFTPSGYFDLFKEKGIPTDYPFSIKPSELSASDWLNVFGLEKNSESGALIEKIVNRLFKRTKDYGFEDILTEIDLEDFSKEIKLIVRNRFSNAQNWGLFSSSGTDISQIIAPGQISVIDVSCYATIPGAENLKSLAIGLIAQKAFEERMKSRRSEEFKEVNSAVDLFSTETSLSMDNPMVWFIIDEAHEFLPREGTTGASDALITILREGRQPGVSLILATQQPGKIHTDVITQSDIVISHRLTAKVDVDSLGMIMQSYMRESLNQAIDSLPRETGAALVFDDDNERLFPIRVRPRLTWHGGSAPSAIRIRRELFKDIRRDFLKWEHERKRP